MKLRLRTQNSRIVGQSGIGQAQDLGLSRVARGTTHPLDRTASDYVRAREWAQLYYKEWTARKIVDIPVQDMLRQGWGYEGLDDDQVKEVEAVLKRMGFMRALKQALRMERLVGGAIILMGVKSQDEDPTVPLNVDGVAPGDLTFTNVVPRTNVSSYQFQIDPLESDFGKPNLYTVRQHIIHKSRMMIFDGEPLTDNEVNDLGFVNRSFDGFGVSVLAAIYDDMVRSIGTRQSAWHLINRASVLLIQNESMLSQLASTNGDAALNRLQEMADQMSMFSAAMIDGKNVNIDQYSSNFGSVPELLMSFLQILSAASDIPATRFLGQAPGGLNATGESDLENYYNSIDAMRENRLRPQLEKLMQVLIPSTFGDTVNADDVKITFPPLWNPSELEQAQARGVDYTNVVNAVNAGILSDTEARQEMIDRELLVSEIEAEASFNDLDDFGATFEDPQEGEASRPIAPSQGTRGRIPPSPIVPDAGS